MSERYIYSKSQEIEGKANGYPERHDPEDSTYIELAKRAASAFVPSFKRLQDEVAAKCEKHWNDINDEIKNPTIKNRVRSVQTKAMKEHDKKG